MLIMYKVFDGKTWIEFETYGDLVNYLSKFNRKSILKCQDNTFLNCVGNNPNDTYYSSPIISSISCTNSTAGKVDFGGYKARDKRIIECVIDTFGNCVSERSIFDSTLIKDVLNHTFDAEAFYSCRRKARKPKYYGTYICELPDSAYPDFRRGPIPFIHKSRRYSAYRYIHTTNERRQSCDPEIKEFIRKSRGKNLPDMWFDEPLRDWRNNGWKKQGKRRHQWENKVICREKHKFGTSVYVDNVIEA